MPSRRPLEPIEVMQLSRDDVEVALKQKGFVQNNKDHRKFHFYTLKNKKTAIWTKTSHGTKYKYLQDGLLGRVARQMKLTKSQLGSFVECGIEQKEYEKILSEQARL